MTSRTMISRALDSLGLAGVLVIVAFVAVIVVGLYLSRRQGLSERAELQQFAESRGFSFARDGSARLDELLSGLEPNDPWIVHAVAAERESPEPAWLFAFGSGSRSGDGVARGVGCLIETGAELAADTVRIHPRVPGLDLLLPRRVEAGSPRFAQAFVVECERPEVATACVTPELERVLLAHFDGAGWHTTTWISRGRVLVTTTWAHEAQEWARLIELTRALTQAVGP